LIYPPELATGPCITNQLRDVSTICRRSWYIDAHTWKIYDFKIEIVPFIVNFSIDLLTSLYSDTKILSKYIPSLQRR
jgi:hypothetical protein